MDKIDPKAILQTLKNKKLVNESVLKLLCQKVAEIFEKEENLVRLRAPITVCGDIHGQFEDLLELFEIGGEIPETNYLFLGDIVDRGFKSVETLIYLLTLKVLYPRRIFIIRGNHESRQTTQVYGFYDECVRKYGSLNVWRACVEVFDMLPLAALIEEKVLCVHGGISPHLPMISDINKLERKKEIPHDGPMCDLMWSDPEEIEGWKMSPRGAGYQFGADVVKKFNHENGINLIARAHQLAFEGYKYMFNQSLITVWSAPNYVYR